MRAVSNIHVLEGSRDGDSYRLVFHISIPNVANQAGVSYRDAIAQDPTIDRASAVPSLNPAEQNQLDNGELVERVVTFHTHPGQTSGDLARIDALYTATVAVEQAAIQERYKYFGFARDVP